MKFRTGLKHKVERAAVGFALAAALLLTRWRMADGGAARGVRPCFEAVRLSFGQQAKGNWAAGITGVLRP